jgi:SAM-dependent methyltransferase
VSDPRAVRRIYDTVAADYAAKFADDLDAIAFDRERVEAVAARARGGRALDLACGPGHVAGYLWQRGVTSVGVDLSPVMAAEARRRHDAVPFLAGDIGALPFADHSFDAAVAFYCLLYFRVDALAALFREIARVLVPSGLFLAATHLGEGEVDGPTEFLGHEVESVKATLFRRGDIETALTGAAFDLLDVRERGPMDHEAPTQRAYVLARAPSRLSR